MAARAKRLGMALGNWHARGDRVATLAGTTTGDLETTSTSCAGGSSTLNLRLPRTTRRRQHAGDRFLIVDGGCSDLGLVQDRATTIERVIVIGDNVPDGAIGYEELLATAAEDEWSEPRSASARRDHVLHERHDRVPKAVLYSHRGIVLHSIVSAWPERSLQESGHDAAGRA